MSTPVGGAAPVPPTVVLVEGVSDAAVLRVFAPEAPGVLLLTTGGATGAARTLAALRERPARVLALCDLGEAALVRHALGVIEVPTGLFVCHADLEDELLRATGDSGALAVLDSTGDLRAFRVLQRQPEHRGRPVDRQLHRFLGAGSGRKARIGAALAASLPGPPPPIAALIERLTGPR